MDVPIFMIALIPWAVGLWAMAMMLISMLKRERFTLGRIFCGGFVTADYNRRYFWIMAACILTDVIFVAIVNVFFMIGWLKL